MILQALIGYKPGSISFVCLVLSFPPLSSLPCLMSWPGFCDGPTPPAADLLLTKELAVCTETRQNTRLRIRSAAAQQILAFLCSGLQAPRTEVYV